MAAPVLDVPMDLSSSSDDLDDYDSDDSSLDSSDDSDDLSSSETEDDSITTYEETPPTEEADELAAATEELDALCSQATKELSLLPRKTRNKLASQTRKIFKSYEQHGSQQRLAIALEKFLLAPDGGLDFKPVSPPLRPVPKVTRNIDPECGPMIRDSPYHTVDLKFEISGDMTIPPYLIPSLDRIFGLYSLEARALLKHHCEKYGDEPVFRAGIREYMQSQLEGILRSTHDDSLSLTPETRTFLRGVYDEYPDLNLAEKRMLARNTRLGLESIDMFWEDMHLKRRAYQGMKLFIVARELEQVNEEKRAEEERLKSRIAGENGVWTRMRSFSESERLMKQEAGK